MDYLEPLSGNEQALGYDIAPRACVAKLCRKPANPEMIMTPDPTVQERRPLALIGPSTSRRLLRIIAAATRQVEGFVLVFRVGNMIEEALRPANPAGLTLGIPGAEPGFPAMSYFHPSLPRQRGHVPQFVVSDPIRNRLVLCWRSRETGRSAKPAPALFAAHSQHAGGVLLGRY